jgi:hypothetical protein
MRRTRVWLLALAVGCSSSTSPPSVQATVHVRNTSTSEELQYRLIDLRTGETLANNPVVLQDSQSCTAFLRADGARYQATVHFLTNGQFQTLGAIDLTGGSGGWEQVATDSGVSNVLPVPILCHP